MQLKITRKDRLICIKDEDNLNSLRYAIKTTSNAMIELIFKHCSRKHWN